MNQITVTQIAGFTQNANIEYDIRRKIEKASSSGVSIEKGNDNIIADTLSVYVDGNADGYVASNSLPKYEITKKKSYSSFALTPSTTISNHFKGYDSGTNQYSILGFDSNVPFITGDEIVYTSSGSDNVIEYGETVQLSMILENIGSDPANNVNVSIFTDDDLISFLLKHLFFYLYKS